MPRTITLAGNKLTLVGRRIASGAFAPDASLTTQDLGLQKISGYAGKIRLVSSFPSLDTPVCDLQIKEFNKAARGLSSDVVVIGVSKDLPFAQKRFCQEHGISNEVLLSDYKMSSFGANYGLLIKEANLLARSVMIIDKTEVVRYFKVVGELSHAPDYAEALAELGRVVKSPSSSGPAGERGCKPCEVGTPPIAKADVDAFVRANAGWEVKEEKRIVKEYAFDAHSDAVLFASLIGIIADEQGHHPTVTVSYRKARVSLSTHAAGGITRNDLIMAGIIDELMS